MSRFVETWLPRFFFVATLTVAGLLSLTVLLAPLIDPASILDPWACRLLSLFAGDAMVRRTALVGSAGLIVTACVFFRPRPGRAERKSPTSGLPTPGNFAGA